MKNLLIILLIGFIAFSCNHNNTKDNSEQEQVVSKDSVVDNIKVSTLTPKDLKAVLPDTLPGFNTAPFSEFSAKESDRIIHTAKHQFFSESEQKSVVMDITDYGSIEYVPFSDIYSEPPFEINMKIDTLISDAYKGYMIWSPVDFTGRVNVISKDRFVVQIRSTSNDTIDKFLKHILNKFDFQELDKLYQNKIKK